MIRIQDAQNLLEESQEGASQPSVTAGSLSQNRNQPADSELLRKKLQVSAIGLLQWDAQ